MSRFFYAHEITEPEDVVQHLAKQERHWKKGYWAYELAQPSDSRRYAAERGERDPNAPDYAPHPDGLHPQPPP